MSIANTKCKRFIIKIYWIQQNINSLIPGIYDETLKSDFQANSIDWRLGSGPQMNDTRLY